MDFYRLLKLFGKLKSPKARLLGLYVMHTARRRYIGIYLDPVLSCNFRCKMCYFSDEEKRKEMHGILSEQDMETIAKALFHRALKLQIGCGALQKSDWYRSFRQTIQCAIHITHNQR